MRSMDNRILGRSGLRVPALSFGAGTFGGNGRLFGAWGETDARQARRLVDICLDAGVYLFDTADVYSDGASEEILGDAVKGRRDRVLLSTKAGPAPGQRAQRRRHVRPPGSSAPSTEPRSAGCTPTTSTSSSSTPTTRSRRSRRSCRRSTRSLHAGKLRYVGVSNFSGWQLMKSLTVAERYGYPRYVAEPGVLLPHRSRLRGATCSRSASTRGSAQLVWSPLGWGRLTGPHPAWTTPSSPGAACMPTEQFGPPVDDERLYRVVDALEEVARGGRQAGAAGRTELVAPAADGRKHHHRGPQRRPAPPEPRCGRLDAQPGTGGTPRHGQCRGPHPTRTSRTSARKPSPVGTRRLSNQRGSSTTPSARRR